MAALLTYRSRDSFETRFGRRSQVTKPSPSSSAPLTPPLTPKFQCSHNDGHRSSTNLPNASGEQTAQIFSAQSYLRYQGDKFTARFDANCYIHITRKMDTHDLVRGRGLGLSKVLASLPPRAVVFGIASDGLFTISEQRELAAHIPDAELVVIESPDGHDGFLLEFEQIDGHIQRFLRTEYPALYAQDDHDGNSTDSLDFGVKKTSMFGEAEVDIAQW